MLPRLPDMPPPSPSGLLPKCLNGLSQQILHLWMGHTLVTGPLEQTVGTLTGKQLVQHRVEDEAGHADAHHDDAAVTGCFGVFLG